MSIVAQHNLMKILILKCKLLYCVDIMTLPEHLIKAINFLLCTLL